VGICGLDLSDSGSETSSYEHCNEPSVFMKSRRFIYWETSSFSRRSLLHGVRQLLSYLSAIYPTSEFDIL